MGISTIVVAGKQRRPTTYPETSEARWERWGAAAFERGSPPVTAPAEEIVASFAAHREGLLAQSLLFALSVGGNLWFLGSLRASLHRAEGGSGRVAAVAVGAGVLGVGLNALVRAQQIALALASRGEVEPQLAAMISGLGYAIATIAYVPVAVLLAAVALLTRRARAFPAWLGWLAAIGAAAHLVAACGIVAERGPLMPGGWLTYVDYATLAAWPLAITGVMVARLGRVPVAGT